jgi:hypothetical protein
MLRRVNLVPVSEIAASIISSLLAAFIDHSHLESWAMINGLDNMFWWTVSSSLIGTQATRKIN